MFDVDKASDFEDIVPGGQPEWQKSVEENSVKEAYDAAMQAAEASYGIYEGEGNAAGVAAAQHGRAKVMFARSDAAGAKGAAEDALSKYRAAGDKGGEAAVLHTLARLQLDVQKLDEADRTESLDKVEKLASEAIDCCKTAGSKKSEASVTVTLAKALFLRGQLDEAIEKADRAAMLFETLEEAEGRAAALITKSTVNLFYGSGKWDAAAKAAKEAVATLKKVEGKASAMQREADAQLLMCAAYIPAGRTDDALTAARTALGLAEALGGSHKLAVTIRALTFTLASTGNVEEALGRFDQALGAMESVDDQQLKATLLVVGSMAHRVKFTATKTQTKEPAWESHGRATSHLPEAVGIFESLNDKGSSFMAKLELAQIHIASGNTMEGMGLAQEAKDYFEEKNDKAGEAIAMLTLAEALNANGEAETAYGAAKKAQENFNSVGGAGEGAKAAAEMLDMLEAEMRNRREKGSWGAIDPGQFTGDPAGFGGISRAVYTRLFESCIHQNDRPYEVMLDAPMFQDIDSINTSLARQKSVPRKTEASRVIEAGAAAAKAPKKAEGQQLRQVKIKEAPREKPAVVTPAVMGKDALGGRMPECPESLHQRMLELAASGEITATQPEQRQRFMNKRPTFYGEPKWRDAVKMGYIHPEIAPPKGLKWRKVTMGWKLVA